MIDRIIKASIRHNKFVLIVSLFLVVFGLFQAFHLSIDALPDVTNVQVSVVTKAPGLSPSEVEQFITFPIETALNGMPGVNLIRSISRTGVSSVTVVFNDEVDIYFARQLVNERIHQAEADIPPGYGKPELSPIATALGDIYELILLSDRHNPEQLRTYLDWELGPKLKAIPGVIDINVFGGDLKQYQIMIKPSRLLSHTLSLGEILEKLRASNMNVGGGYIQKGPEQWVIRGEGIFKGIEDLRNFPIRTSANGTPLLLSQLAEVTTGPALRFGSITHSGIGEVVGMTVIMLKDQNSREVVKAVKTRVGELQKGLPEGMRIKATYDRSEFIGRTLETVFTNLLEGALLVVIILLFALGTWQGAVLVGMAIPFSVLFAVIFMKPLGIVGNLMSLGAIDFGLLVDGAVVMLESVLAVFAVHHLSKSAAEQIEEGTLKIGRAAVFSIGIILLVYLPLMTLEGVEGKMFRPMAITVALALFGAVAFTLTTFPAALIVLYKKPISHHSDFWNNLNLKIAQILRKNQQQPKPVFFSTIATLAIGLILTFFTGSEFIPRIDEGEIIVDIKRLPSTALTYSKDLNVQMEKVLLEFPEVISAVSRTGRGESAAEPVGTEEGEIMVKLRPKREWSSASDLDSLMEKMKVSLLQRIPATYISMSQPIEDRVNELIAGSKADVVVKIYGDDLSQLKQQAEKIAEKLKNIRGTGDLRVQRILGLPMLEIKTNQEALARYDVKPSEVMLAVEALKVGANAGKIFEGLKRFDLKLMLGVDASSLEAIEDIPILTSHGTIVPLGMISEIKKNEGPAAIYRESLKRRVFVEVNIRGRDLVSYVNEAQSETRSILEALPEGYEVKWGGQFENFTRARNQLFMVAPLIALIIFGMLMATFKSLRYALGVCSIVPLSLAGGIIALYLRGLPFSIPAAVGLIALSGITVLTGVVYANRLQSILETGEKIEDAVILASTQSARAILTTELIAAIGFLPMAISSGAGAEVQRPLATVVIGGIFIGTLLAQLLLPLLMERLLNRKAKNLLN